MIEQPTKEKNKIKKSYEKFGKHRVARSFCSSLFIHILIHSNQIKFHVYEKTRETVRRSAVTR